MNDAPRHAAPLVRAERNRVGSLDVDQELAVEDEKELVLVIVLVPMKVAVNHPEPDDGVVDRGERLVKPRLMRRSLRGHVDQLEVAEPLAVSKLDVSDPTVEPGEDRPSLWLDDRKIDVLARKRPDRVQRFPAAVH